MSSYWRQTISNTGYWVGRVEFGTFICKKHSDKKKLIRLHTNAKDKLYITSEDNQSLPVQMLFVQHLDRFRLG